MAAIVWLELNEVHPYYPTHGGHEEKPQDGYELHSQWIGEDANERTATGIRRRKYWLQVFERGSNDRKALLIAYGIPAPPEVSAEHIADANKFLKWDNVRWEVKHRGAAWIFRE